MRHIRSASLLVLLCAGALRGQVVTPGRFVDPEGKPIAGATVTLATSDAIVFDTFRPTEVTTATTDERGRFKVSLAAGRFYSAWAVGPEQDGGAWRSAVVDDPLVGEPLELVATVRDRRDRLTIDGLAKLPGERPLRARLTLHALQSPVFEAEIDAEGAVGLPAWPAARFDVEIVDADGFVRHRWQWQASEARPMPIGEPESVRLSARDDRGQPLVGAVVAASMPQFRGRARRLSFLPTNASSPLPVVGRTGADGTVELSLVRPMLFHRVDGPDSGTVPAGLLVGHLLRDGVVDQGWDRAWAQQREFAATRPAAAPIEGRLHRGGAPIADRGVLLRFRHLAAGGERGVTWSGSVEDARVVRTDRDGRFSFPRDPLASDLQLAFEQAQEGDERGAAPILLLPSARAPEQPIDVDLDRLRLLTVQLLDEGRGPCTRARLGLIRGVPGSGSDFVVLAPDRAGRVRVLLQPGEWLLWATDGRLAASHLLHAAEEPSELPLELALAALPTMRGRVVDGRGAPVPSVTMLMGSTRYAADVPDRTPLEALLAERAHELNSRLAAAVRCAPDGSFEWPFLEVPGLEFDAAFDGKNVPLEPQEGVEVVVSR